jgi:hypothetical protein
MYIPRKGLCFASNHYTERSNTVKSGRNTANAQNSQPPKELIKQYLKQETKPKCSQHALFREVQQRTTVQRRTGSALTATDAQHPLLATDVSKTDESATQGEEGK